jgi:hypothetical protein
MSGSKMGGFKVTGIESRAGEESEANRLGQRTRRIARRY